MELWGYISAILMGLSLGLIGGGGSILTVPILVYLFKVPAVLATAYSLFIVGITALVGGANYLRNKEVDLKTAFLFGIPSFVGVYLTRAFVVPQLPDVLIGIQKSLFIMLVFALLMVVASLSMIKNKKNSGTSKLRLTKAQRIVLIILEGLIVGAVTGFVGAGGGFLIIPALVLLVGLPMRIAVGTSLFIIAVKSLIGFIGDVQHQSDMDWQLLMTLSIIAIVGLIIGLRFSKKISEQSLKKGFGYFVLVMGALILIDQTLKI